MDQCIGNVLLCSGNGKLSKRIKWYNKKCGVVGFAAEVSHVALIAPGQQVFESTTFNAFCGKKGVQLNPFHDWLTAYNGRVWERRLYLAMPGSTLTPMWLKMLELIGTKYDHGIPGWIELLLTIPRLNLRDKKSRVNCAQVACLVYQAQGILGPKVNSSNLPPWTWVDQGGYVDSLLRGATLSAAEQLK